jgi:hypothetical protein
MLGNQSASSKTLPNNEQSKRVTWLALSSAVSAVILYSVINAAMHFADYQAAKRHKTRIGQTTVTQQAFEGAAELLKSQNGSPTVVLVGSSLVLAPFWSADLNHFKGVGDCWHHHQSKWMEQLLTAAGMPHTSVINFGLPGLVVSDAYLITEKLFKGPTKPTIAFYGIAPRDFMDDFLGAHTQTPLFERLVTVPDALQLGDLYFSTPQERLDFILQKVVYLYGKRGRYQTRVSRTLNKAAERIFATGTSYVAADEDSRALGFLQEQNRPFVWAASIKEYKARYKTFNEVQFERQKKFLDAMLKLNKQRGITTVLVNMPLTPDNLRLMPAGLYDRYMRSIGDLVARNEVSLLDLHNSGQYADESFYDTVHLNARGGEQISFSLAQFLVQHKNSTNIAGANRSTR